MNFSGGKNSIFTSTTFQGTEDRKQEGEWSLTSEDKELIIKGHLLCCYAGKVCDGRKQAEILHRADGAGFAMRTLHQLLIGNCAMQSLLLEIICPRDTGC